MKRENPTLAAIYVAPFMGKPMNQYESASVMERQGLVGDRYTIGKGAFSNSKVPKVRDITLISRAGIVQANAGLETPFAEDETRRNLVIDGIDPEELNDLVNVTFRVGDIAMRGTELCHPCKRPERLASKPGFEEAFQNVGGIRAQILESGIIAVGNEIIIQ